MPGLSKRSVREGVGLLELEDAFLRENRLDVFDATDAIDRGVRSTMWRVGALLTHI